LANENLLLDLKEFALKKIAAEKYPNDYHWIKIFRCDICGITPLRIKLEHHAGYRLGSSISNDFVGIFWGTCTKCDKKIKFFSITNEYSKTVRVEYPKCGKCGNDAFYVLECERYEGENGLKGFFDEGIVVGKCSECNTLMVIVQTD